MFIFVNISFKEEKNSKELSQVLPHASEATLAALERNISMMPNPSELASSRVDAADIANSLLSGLGGVGSETKICPQYGPCSIPVLKERMFRAVASIPRNELAELLEKDVRRTMIFWCQGLCATKRSRVSEPVNYFATLQSRKALKLGANSVMRASNSNQKNLPVSSRARWKPSSST